MGMAGGFLWLSPSLRESLGDVALQSLAFLDAHSPLSYLAVGAAALATLFMLVRSVEAPR
jgi:hypothetical protein